MTAVVKRIDVGLFGALADPRAPARLAARAVTFSGLQPTGARVGP